MEPTTLYTAGFGVGTTLVCLVLLRIFQRIVSPSHQLGSTNAAWRLLQVGHVFAVFLLAAAVVKHGVTGADLTVDLTVAAVYGLVGLIVIHVAGAISTRALFRAQLRAELDRGNAAAGLAAGAHFVAIGILASRSVVGGDLADVGLALIFFVIGLASHALLVSLYRLLTAYDDAEQVHGENAAAAISYAGISVAVAILIARALTGEGEFPGWGPAMLGFGGVALCALGLYPVRQIVVQWLLLGARPSLRGGRIDEAIARDRDAALASLEATTYLATALAIAALA
jgi:uncharacterized membrane protein YjfL (UPF0719 family)